MNSCFFLPRSLPHQKNFCDRVRNRPPFRIFIRSAGVSGRCGDYVIKLALGPLCLLVLLTAGCGGESNDTSPTDRGEPPPAAIAPSITAQPAASSVTAPATATFSIAASGAAPLTYQWRTSTDGT